MKIKVWEQDNEWLQHGWRCNPQEIKGRGENRRFSLEQAAAGHFAVLLWAECWGDGRNFHFMLLANNHQTYHGQL